MDQYSSPRIKWKENQFVIASYIDNILPDNGWWYFLNKPGEYKYTEIEDVFPSISRLFGIEKKPMEIFLTESGCYKKHGNVLHQRWQGWEDLRELVNIRSNFERTQVSLGPYGLQTLILLGYCTLDPRAMWQDFYSKKRRFYPPLHLVSREQASITRNQIIEIVKNSDDFTVMMQMYLSTHYNDTVGISKRKLVVKQGKEETNEEIATSIQESDEAEKVLSAKQRYKLGTVPTIAESPLMNIFKVPSNNSEALQRLHYEISNILMKENVIEYPHPIRPSVNMRFANMPSGNSKATNYRRAKVINTLIDDTDKEGKEILIENILNMIDIKHNEEFFNFCVKKGYCQKQTPIMSALFWNSMSEAASLRINQQRIINKFLTTHFGYRVVEKEKKLSEFTKEYIKYEKYTMTLEDKKQVTVWFRNLAHMARFQFRKMDKQNLCNANSIEICLGGDHGKESYIFMAIILIRYKNNKEPHRIEVKIGEINDEKDKIEYLTELLKKINIGLTEMNIDITTGNCFTTFHPDGAIQFSKHIILLSDCTSLVTNFHVVGDLKALFQISGRDGYDGCYCLYCKAKSKDWKSQLQSSSDYLNSELWSIEKINNQALLQFQNISNDVAFTSVGIRGYPLLTCIPLHRYLPPLLHILLGLGNDIYSKFKEWIDERIEKLSPEELEARNMTLLAEIKLDDILIKFDDLKKQVQNLTTARIELNAVLKNKNLSQERKQELLELKNSLLSQLDKARSDRNKAEEEKKEYNSMVTQCKQAEAEHKKNSGITRKAVMHEMESTILKSHKISRSCYNGGDLEGNDVRRLMAKGTEVFGEIASFLKTVKPECISDDEIVNVCVSYGRLSSIMDGIFSILHSKRGTVTNEKIIELKNDLNLLRVKWKELNLSFTPKFHLLYEHTPHFLQTMNGFFDMGEDAIERWHQIRMRHHARIRSLRSENLQKQNQSKYEFTTTNSDIQKLIEDVNNKRKRNIERRISLKSQNDNIKREARITRRRTIKQEVENEPRVKMKTPREKLKLDYRSANNL